MKCEKFLLLIDDYIEDELELQENSEISEHLAVCESCASSYKKIRQEQEVFERYFLEAEATPALWKNLQSAIREEKIARPDYSSTSIAAKFGKVLRDISIAFSPGKTAFVGLGIIVLCTFIFLFVGRKNPSVEYAERDSKISPVSQIDEKAEISSSASGVNKKEDTQINQTTSVPETTARQLQISQLRRPSKQVNALPGRNLKTVSKQAKSENDLLPGEQKYLETIARLTAEVKSIEPHLPPVLSSEYKRNLSTVNQAIAETRRAAQRHPKNPDAATFVWSAYRGKITLLAEVAKQSKISTPSF